MAASTLVNKINVRCQDNALSKQYLWDTSGNKPAQYVYKFEFPYISTINQVIYEAQSRIQDYNSEQSVEKRNEAERKALQSAIGESALLENVIRVIMAHFETFMHMMYQCVDEINSSQRTIDSMGLSAPDPFNVLADINPDNAAKSEDVRIPPFPQVAEVTQDQNDWNNDQRHDTWIGDVKVTKQSFLEETLVRDFFNGADTVASTLYESDKSVEDAQRERDEMYNPNRLNGQLESSSVLSGKYVKYMTNVFDILLDGHIYPTSSDVVNDINAFIHAISLRAFATLSLDYYSDNHIKNSYWEYFGEADAYNFIEQHHFPGVDSALAKILQNKDKTIITEDVLWQIVSDSALSEELKPLRNNSQWNGDTLFDSIKGYPWLYQYPTTKPVGYAYPIQDYNLNDNGNLAAYGQSTKIIYSLGAEQR